MKTQVCLFFVVVAVFSLEVQAQGKRPDYLALCARRDPQFNKCMVERIREIVPDLLAARFIPPFQIKSLISQESNVHIGTYSGPTASLVLTDSLQLTSDSQYLGDPELDLPALNPVHIAELSIDTDITEDVRSRMFFKDINIYNTDSVQIKNVRSNINDNKLELEVDIQFPKLFLDGEYRSDVRFRGLPFINKGSFNLTLGDVSMTMKLTGKPFIKEDESYIQLQHFTMSPKIESLEVYASNLFGGNKELANAALSIANKYWFIFYNESLPFLEEKWDTIMTDIANNVFLKVPYDHMFPSD
uniref:Uncharacterized protein n=1 Tax=Timema douglasi TaxID=61478 RepID=A0A7R8V9D0_TIMDO|nr:unnamed protein product [Timema douglasi]